MSKQFTSQSLVLMAVAIAINISVGYLVGSVLKIPIYMDSIGTVLVGALVGPWAGAVTGMLANIIWGLTIGPTSNIAFFYVAGVIGLMAGFFGARGWFSSKGSPKTLGLSALAGILTGIVAAILSAPMAYFVFGGTTGGGTDLLVVAFREMTNNVFTAVLGQGIVSDPLDKTITYIVVWAILLAVPVTTKTIFNQGEKTI
jgi:energy-coupling factor transport system substrate-specific component